MNMDYLFDLFGEIFSLMFTFISSTETSIFTSFPTKVLLPLAVMFIIDYVFYFYKMFLEGASGSMGEATN